MTDIRLGADRRVLKTRAALREAMLALMGSKGWDDLSIQEICDAANVGRSTFYVHFQSKADLLSESMNDLRDALAAHAGSSTGPDFAFLTGLLAHMQEQRNVFKAAIGRRGGNGVARRFTEMVVQLVEMELQKRSHPATQTPWVARFLAGGIVDSMAWWADSRESLPIGDLERELNQLAQAALGATSRPRPHLP